MYKPEVILLPSKEILVPEARLNHCVVCQSRGSQSWSPLGFRLQTGYPHRGVTIQSASEDIVDQHSDLLDSVGYQGLRNFLLIPLRAVGVEAEIGMGIRSKVSLVLAYSAGSPLT